MNFKTFQLSPQQEVKANIKMRTPICVTAVKEQIFSHFLLRLGNVAEWDTNRKKLNMGFNHSLHYPKHIIVQECLLAIFGLLAILWALSGRSIRLHLHRHRGWKQGEKQVYLMIFLPMYYSFFLSRIKGKIGKVILIVSARSALRTAL